jgi:2',3'-cyclic-nucleotide 2'-phosphodiesterase (5'-nucleotidase family)
MLGKLMAAVMALLMSGTMIVPVSAEDNGSTDEIRILFTSDLHDHALPFPVEEQNGEVKRAGGYAYLKRAVDENRTENSILVDAGDFSMGTMFSFLFEESAPTLSMLGSMGYDAVTSGSDEFLYGPAALARSLEAGTDIPSIVMANMEYGSDSDSQDLKTVMDSHGFGAYKIVERSGRKIGIFGVLDTDDDKGSIHFEDALETAEDTVKDLRREDCDIIVALYNEDSEESRAEDLARKVDDIDVIVRGGSHDALSKPVMVNDTAIVKADSYGRSLGVLDLDPEAHTVKNYELVYIDDSFPADPAVERQLEAYKTKIENNTLSAYGFDMDKVLVRADFSLDPVEEEFGNSSLGDFITDAYREAYERWYETFTENFQKQKNTEIGSIIERKGLDRNGVPTPAPGEEAVSEPSASPKTESDPSLKQQLIDAWEGNTTKDEPVSPVDPEVLAVKERKPAFVNTPVSVTAAGNLQGTLLKGDLTVQDAFGLSGSHSLDGNSSMVLAFVKGSDLRKVPEMDATIGQSLRKDARLFFDGLKYEYDNQRMAYNRVEETYVEESPGYFVPVDDETLYPLITNLYTARLLGQADELSEGKLSIRLCDQDGKETEDISSLILQNPDTGTWIQDWQVAASHLEDMNTVDGVPVLSDSYREAEVSKKEDSAFHLIRYLKHTSEYAAGVYLKGLIIIAVSGVILAILLRIILNRIHRNED